MTTAYSHADMGFDLSLTHLTTIDMANGSPSPPRESTVVGDVSTKTPPAGQFPPPKTDKPRPHVCTTCQRSFARLEHLKRHERSHTKEKPFECDQCTRCFARRDLLLRHQQKLHQSTTPAARPRNRRESTTAVTPSSRVRKGSMASAAGSGSVAATLRGGALDPFHGAGNAVRPRANTISHVDANAMHLISPAGAAANTTSTSAASGPRGLPAFHSRHPSLAGLSVHGLDQIPLHSPAFVGMSSAMGHRGVSHGLPKLNTSALHPFDPLDFSGSLRTAPALPVFSPDFDLESSVFGPATTSTSSTINPNALHYSDSPQSLALDPTSAFAHGLGGYNDVPSTRDSFEWLTGFENPLSLSSALDESAIEGSSPSAVSTGSQSGISDIMLDGTAHLHASVTMPPPLSSSLSPSAHAIPSTLSMWQPDGGGVLSSQHLHAPHSSFTADMAATSFSDLLSSIPMSPSVLPMTTAMSAAAATTTATATMGMSDTANPSSLTTSAPRHTGSAFFSTPPPSLSSVSPSLLSNMNQATFGQALGLGGGNAPETPSSMNGSSSSVRDSRDSNHPQPAPAAGQSPVSTITDATRSAIVNALNTAFFQISPFGMRKYSFGGATGIASYASPTPPEQSVPSTADLQRYVGAYLRHFQPHFPFLHVATMSFEIPSSSSSASASSSSSASSFHGTGTTSVGGSGCLILSMAAIGALYELDHEQSRLLFTMAKRMIQLYLDERRKANVRKADFRRTPGGDVQSHQQNGGSSDTPVWLVQAMLLNVVYGHNGSDKRAGEIASTHCAALVSLAQGAELLQPRRVEPLSVKFDLSMSDSIDPSDLWKTDDAVTATKAAKEEALWLKWKEMEGRKRTLYAIFVLSSLLVSSYNHTPALTNSEILLDLPCDEEFFAASSLAEFQALGGVAAANHNRMTFHGALGNLLRASENRSSGDPASESVPSTFGCFILINALHNYIWETRQRHHNKVWTNEETDKMHRHIEPALEAWQRVWEANPRRVIDTANPSKMDALSADSVPLLDLAYVRLFVNLARSKEKFWQRNWDGLAEELSHGREIVQHAEQSPDSNADSALTDPASDFSGTGSSVFADSPATQLSSSPDFGGGGFASAQAAQQKQPRQQKHESDQATSRREKHLRKAALYAADALAMPDKIGFKLADFANRDLPLQSALCVFDCAQVLAEWVATLQDRVGRYLGVLDQDVDVNQVPAIMLLEDEDVKLLTKVKDVLSAAEATMNMDLASGTGDPVTGISTRMASRMQMGEQIGYGAKILSIIAYTLGKAAVWPVTHLMAECLENHANHMRARAEKSVSTCG